MKNGKLLLTAVLALALVFPAAVLGQTIAKGSIGGTVYDPTGAVVPGAKVTATGAFGTREATSGPDGTFVFQALEPGTYTVKVEAPGFTTAEAKDILVRLNERAGVSVTLQPGAVTEVVEVTDAAIGVDVTTTTGGGTVHGDLLSRSPIGRNISQIAYVVGAAVDSGGVGAANPSISGGTGLENLYIIDGVNITNTGFGGIGAYSIIYGSLGQGVQFDFVKEVQVKTSGFEAQYGQALGGLVNMVTKSGSNELHGGVYAYFSPSEFESNRRQPNTFVGSPLADPPTATTDAGVAGSATPRARFFQGNALTGVSQYDIGGDIGGYLVKDRVFFYGGFNWVHTTNELEGPSNFLSGAQGGIDVPGYLTSYSGKITAHLTESQNHTAEFSVFGDPALRSLGPNRAPDRQAGGALQSDFADRSFSALRFGGHNITARYNGVITPKWLVNGSFSWARNDFDEVGFPEIFGVQDRTEGTFGGVNPVGDGLPNATDSRGLNNIGGIGFWEVTKGENYQYNINGTNNLRGLGNHQFDYGFTYEDISFDWEHERSGPDFPVPCTLFDGTDATLDRVDSADCGQTTFGFDGRLRTGGESGFRLQQIRGAFTGNVGSTSSDYEAAYAQDAWEINRYVTLKGGIRWERQKIAGEISEYTFAANWSPRLGIIVDPLGKRKTKVFYNWGRFYEKMPSDLAVRSLSEERQYIGEFFAVTNPDSPNPLFDSDVNPTPGCPTGASLADCLHNPDNWILDEAHFLSPGSFSGGVTPFLPDTDMQYQDEWVIGAEHEFPGGIIASFRYVDRKIRNIIEDLGGASPGMVNAGFLQHFLFGNPGSTLDAYINVTCDDPSVDPFDEDLNSGLGCIGSFYSNPAGYDSDADGIADNNAGMGFPVIDPASSPAEIGSDGILDGFPDIVRRYKAYEFGVEKRFSKNWQFLFNYRYAKLRGNYEGLFRNDNDQSDPNLTSIFDFIGGPDSLLADQFVVGFLPGDRRHVANVYGSYLFDWGLNLGSGFRVETGVPIDVLQAHPIYLNQGEVPLGGRGAAGRTPRTYGWDAHADYTWKLNDTYRLKFVADLFNITNTRKAFRVDNFADTGFLFGVTPNLQPNPDFGLVGGQTNAFQRPFNARFAVRLEF